MLGYSPDPPVSTAVRPSRLIVRRRPFKVILGYIRIALGLISKRWIPSNRQQQLAAPAGYWLAGLVSGCPGWGLGDLGFPLRLGFSRLADGVLEGPSLQHHGASSWSSWSPNRRCAEVRRATLRHRFGEECRGLAKNGCALRAIDLAAALISLWPCRDAQRRFHLHEIQ